MTITEFLLARIAEDEAAAHRCAGAFPGSWEVEDRGHHAHVACDAPAFHRVSEIDQRQTSADWLGGALGMIADFQPARVLAECEAKRAIIKQHGDWPVLVERPPVMEVDSTNLQSVSCRMSQDIAMLTERGYVSRFGVEPPTAPMIRTLASIYSDHPDYQDEWKP